MAPSPTMASLEKAVADLQGTDGLDTAQKIGGEIAFQLRIDLFDINKGLKKMHKDFERVSKQLRPLYATKDPKLQAGLAALLTDLVSDKVLRDKFIHAGALEFLVSLLSSPTVSNSYLALRAMSVLTTHAGPAQAEHVAKASRAPLVALAKSLDKQDERFPLVVAVIVHGAHVDDKKTGVKAEDMLDVLQAAAIHPDPHTHGHGGDAFCWAVTDHQKLFYKSPDRLKHIVGQAVFHFSPKARMSAVWALYSVTTGVAEVESIRFDIQKMMTQLPKLSVDAEINAVMMRDMPATDTMKMLNSSLAFQKLMQAAIESGHKLNFADLGDKLVELIRSSEYGVSDGMWSTSPVEPDPHPLSGKQSSRPYTEGPFATFAESLPLAAKALRARDGQDSVKAIILDCKFFLLRSRHGEAGELALKSIDKHPQEPYVWYILSMMPDKLLSLKYAKQGLKTAKITGYMERNMHGMCARTCCDIAGHLMSDRWNEYCEYKERDALALSFVRSAMESVKAFLAVAPPDSRLLREILCYYLTFSPILTPNVTLTSLQPYADRLVLTDRILTILHGPPARTQQRTAWDIIQRHYDAAKKDGYQAIFAAFDEVRDTTKDKTVEGNSNDEGLARLMQGLKCSGGGDEPKRSNGHYLVDYITDLYLCDHCGSASAKLQRCSRCNNARYCDRRCQTSAWKAHKQNCSKTAALK